MAHQQVGSERDMKEFAGLPGEQVGLIVPARPFAFRVKWYRDYHIWRDRGRTYECCQYTAEGFRKSPIPPKFEGYDGAARRASVLRHALKTRQTDTRTCLAAVGTQVCGGKGTPTELALRAVIHLDGCQTTLTQSRTHSVAVYTPGRKDEVEDGAYYVCGRHLANASNSASPG